MRLWRSLGFTVVGTVPEAFRSARHGLVGLHVMHLPLTGGVTGGITDGGTTGDLRGG